MRSNWAFVLFYLVACVVWLITNAAEHPHMAIVIDLCIVGLVVETIRRELPTLMRLINKPRR